MLRFSSRFHLFFGVSTLLPTLPQPPQTARAIFSRQLGCCYDLHAVEAPLSSYVICFPSNFLTSSLFSTFSPSPCRSRSSRASSIFSQRRDAFAPRFSLHSVSPGHSGHWGVICCFSLCSVTRPRPSTPFTSRIPPPSVLPGHRAAKPAEQFTSRRLCVDILSLLTAFLAVALDGSRLFGWVASAATCIAQELAGGACWLGLFHFSLFSTPPPFSRPLHFP